MKNEEERTLYLVIKILAHVFKWLFLVVGVITTALVITVLVTGIFNETLGTTIFTEVMAIVTRYSVAETTALIEDLGMTKVVIGGVAIGLSQIINYIILYVLAENFIKVYATLDKDNIFTEENVKTVNACLPLAILLTLSQPVIIFVTSFATKLYNQSDINISGIGVFAIVYIISIIFSKGYETTLRLERSLRELSEKKVELAEEKIASIKKTATTKKVVEKKPAAKKTVTKKAEAKKEPAKKVAAKKTTTTKKATTTKKTTTAKKAPAKKATTKKTTTKKTTKK